MNGGHARVTLRTLVLRSLTFHWRTNLAVVLGVAAATAVLAGALVVGDSVRGSLRDIALGRLGRTDTLVSTAGFFRRRCSAAICAPPRPAPPRRRSSSQPASSRTRHRGAAPRTCSSTAWTSASGRFTGCPTPTASTSLRRSPPSSGAQPGDALLTRVQKPAQIPIESLFGRKEDIGRTLRLQAAGVLPRERLGEFALQPQQAEVRAIFAPLRRLQRDLGVPRLVNTVLLSGVTDGDGLPGRRAAAGGSRRQRRRRSRRRAAGRCCAVDSQSGIVNEALESAARRVGDAARPARDAGVHLPGERHPQGRPAVPVLAGDGHRSVRG